MSRSYSTYKIYIYKCIKESIFRLIALWNYFQQLNAFIINKKTKSITSKQILTDEKKKK